MIAAQALDQLLKILGEVGLEIFAPGPVVVFDTVQIGKANERMQLPAYVAGIALYRETIERLIF